MSTKAKAPAPAPAHDLDHDHDDNNVPSHPFEHLIERNIPLPITRGVKSPYPFDQMEVGESILIRRPDRVVNISNVKQAAEKRLPGTKWTTRKVEGGFRIWRTQ